MCKFLKKIKEKINKNKTDKLFLLIRWENNVPKVITRSNSSNILYKLLDITKNQEVITEEEYQLLKKLKKNENTVCKNQLEQGFKGN